MESRTIETSDGVYEVRELTVKAMRQILPKFDGEDSFDATLEMMSSAVYQNGALIGKDAIEELAWSSFQELQTKVLEVHGMGGEGND